ncbi:MAG: hypothetical protein P4L46_08115 [Fimbriimonas sp.]|nr:hypothetical protein [Fimbriimonas sp.]
MNADDTAERKPSKMKRQSTRWYHIGVAVLLPVVGLPWGLFNLTRSKSRGSGLAMIALSSVTVLGAAAVPPDFISEYKRQSSASRSRANDALMVYASTGDVDHVKSLLAPPSFEWGKDPASYDSVGAFLATAMVSMSPALRRPDVNMEDRLGLTPLMEATGIFSGIDSAFQSVHGHGTGNAEIVRVLIAAGAKVNAQNTHGETALTLADSPEVISAIKNAGGRSEAFRLLVPDDKLDFRFSSAGSVQTNSGITTFEQPHLTCKDVNGKPYEIELDGANVTDELETKQFGRILLDSRGALRLRDSQIKKIRTLLAFK